MYEGELPLLTVQDPLEALARAVQRTACSDRRVDVGVLLPSYYYSHREEKYGFT